MPLTINSNIAALRAGRQLARSTGDLNRSFERLGSGLRINRASDDAAGLAVAGGLQINRRIFNQGLRNINDATSLLNIAQDSVSNLGNILTRIKELATSAANGTLSVVQRRSLDAEAYALTQEYNRIANTTNFNGLSLINGSLSRLNIEAGYGSGNELAIGVGASVSRNIGAGSYSVSTQTTGAGNATSIVVADVNGDNKQDLISVTAGSRLNVKLGDGAGGFTSNANYTVTGAPRALELADVDGDGDLDAVRLTNSNVGIMYNDGNGVFSGETILATGSNMNEMEVGDFDGDGDADIVLADFSNNLLRTLTNTNGTFTSTSTLAATSPYTLAKGDLNGDGILDLMVGNLTGNSVMGFLNDGSGKFTATGVSTAIGAGFPWLTSGDFNHDGYADFASAANGTGAVQVAFGRGDGQFGPITSYGGVSNANAIHTADFDGDGILDLVTGSIADGSITTLRGRADGTFEAAVTTAGSGQVLALTAGDLNGDGVLDIVSGGSGGNQYRIFTHQAQVLTSIPRFDLLSVAGARSAMNLIDTFQQKVSKELGTIGSSISRLDTAQSVLRLSHDNYAAAESQITDVDVAEESSNLLRTQILQQAGAAVLSQANNQLRIAIDLLRQR